MNMPEAEVSLRLAFWLINNRLVDGTVEVSLDGAQVRIGETAQCDLENFMGRHGWERSAVGVAWQCDWCDSEAESTMRPHSNPGRGDVVARLKSGQTLRVEWRSLRPACTWLTSKRSPRGHRTRSQFCM
jgi:hypothetical protein